MCSSCSSAANSPLFWETLVATAEHKGKGHLCLSAVKGRFLLISNSTLVLCSSSGSDAGDLYQMLFVGLGMLLSEQCNDDMYWNSAHDKFTRLRSQLLVSRKLTDIKATRRSFSPKRRILPKARGWWPRT